jgi:hypothetical protein
VIVELPTRTDSAVFPPILASTPSSEHPSPHASSPQLPDLPCHIRSASHSSQHGFLTSLSRTSVLTQKLDPVFSIACALFSIHNFAHPFYFVIAAHSLPKTPGGRVRSSNRIPPVLVTSIESYSFTRITPKPNGILLFQHDPGGGGLISTSLSQNPAGTTATSRRATFRTPCGTARSFPRTPGPSPRGRTADLRLA